MKFFGRVDILNINVLDWAGERLFTGGAERYVLDLAALLRDMGFRPRLIQNAHRPFVRTVRETEVVGIPAAGEFDLAAMAAGFAHATRDAALVIASPVELACGLDAGPPVIGINHGIWWDTPHNRAARADPASHATLLAGLWASTACVCVDTNFVNWLRTLDDEATDRLEYVPNYVDAAQFRPARKDFDAARLTVLYPRRLCVERGFHETLAAFETLLSRQAPLDLHLCGGGPAAEEERAREFVKRHAGRARWSERSMGDMPEVYRESHVVVIPTMFSEGTSFSCLEGMATGNGVIATYVGGLPDLVIDGINGLLVRPGASALAAALQRLVDDRALLRRLAKRAVADSASFSQERWKSHWQSLVTAVMDGSLRAPAARERFGLSWRDEYQAAHERRAQEAAALGALRVANAQLEAQRAAADESRSDALAERDAARRSQQGAEEALERARAQARAAEEQRAAAIARAETAGKERDAAFARADSAGIERDAAIARADAAAKEREAAIAQADAAGKERDVAIARADAAGQELVAERERALEAKGIAAAAHDEATRAETAARATAEAERAQRLELERRFFWASSELSGIQASTGWAVLQALYRVRFALFPRGSRREAAGRRVMRAIRQFEQSRARRRGNPVAPGEGGERAAAVREATASAPAPIAQPPEIVTASTQARGAMRPECCALTPDLVSVVLPVYNQSRLVGASIDSVLAQTYPQLELIVIDDGSTDGIEEVLARHAGDRRVRIYSQHNRGLPGALTSGFARARGEFWTWTSADNLMAPRHLECLVAKLRAEPDLGMTFADYWVIDDRGDVLADRSWRAHNRPDPESGEVRLPRTTENLNVEQDNFIGPCFLYRGWIGRLLGGYSPSVGVEDYDYWMRINALFSIRHLGTDDLLYRYRVHDNTLSARADQHRILAKVQHLMQHEKERVAHYRRRLRLCADDATAQWLRDRGITEEIAGLDELDRPQTSTDYAPALFVSASAARALERNARAGNEVPLIVAFHGEATTPYDIAGVLRRPYVMALVSTERDASRVAAVCAAPIVDAESAQVASAIGGFVRNAGFLMRSEPRADDDDPPPAAFIAPGRRPRVLLQADAFRQGGMENVMINVAVTLREAGIDPLLLVLGGTGPARAHAEADGIEVVRDGVLNARGYRKLLDDRRIALINAHYSTFGVEQAHAAGVPWVQTIHNAYVWLSPESIEAYRRADPLTSAYACVSATVAKYADCVIGLDPRKFRSVPNGIDSASLDAVDGASERARLRHRWGAAENDTVFLNVASILATKAQIPLVEAFARVLERRPGGRLVIVGTSMEPPYEHRLRERMQELGVERRVTIAGYDPDVAAYYYAADVMVLPSHWEGWSLAFGEALYTGIPIVSTRVGAAAEFSSAANVVLVDTDFGDVTALNHANIGHVVNHHGGEFPIRFAEGMLRAAALGRETPAPKLRARLRRESAYRGYADLFVELMNR
jgi:glycosyltransferase involved in cell wall biosynthesis